MTKLKREASEDSLRNIGPRSEYVKRYQIYPLQKTQSCKPPPTIIKADAPVDSITVQKRDYPQHPLVKRQTAKPAPSNIKSEGQHDFRSSYRDQYLDTPVEKRQPYKPSSERPDLCAFDAEPSYRADYPEWKLPERTPRQKVEWVPPQQPFEGESTNVQDFKQHQLSPRVDYRPERKPLQSDQAFMASSDYKDTFRVHEIPPRVARGKDKWSKPTEAFDATTTQQRDFTGQYTAPQRSMRPDREPLQSEAPLDTETTANTSYRHLALPEMYRHKPEQYKRPEGKMDLKTTSTTHFMPHAAQRQNVQKPGSSQILRGKGPMAAETNYIDSFLGTTTDRVKIMKPQTDYEPPTVPMESKTVNKHDFYQHQISPRENYKPSQGPLLSDQPFDDSTDYKDQFKTYPVQPRQRRPREVYEGSKVPLEDRTTVKDSYTGAYQPKRSSFNPDRNPVMSDIPFEGQTTMNNDFKKLEVTRRQFHKPDEYKKPEGTMNMATTHTANYVPHSSQRQNVIKPGSSGILKGHGEMSKVTNYQGDFVDRPVERVRLLKPNNDYEPPSEPMATITTNQSSFFEKGVSKRQSFKPSSEIMKSDMPFDNRTGYRDQFPKHEITPRRMREKEAYQSPSVPLDARTTAQDSYLGAVQPKRDSFRPNQGYVKSDVPLQTDTTAGSSFKPWLAEKRFVHKPNEYTKPEGTMDLTTMNRETYRDVKGERPTLQRLGSSHLLSYGGKFDSTTSYQGDYVQKSFQGRKVVKASNDYAPPTIPFENHTEYRSKLVGYVAPKEKSCKPGNALSDTLGQREAGNPYRIRGGDWRDMLSMTTETTKVA